MNRGTWVVIAATLTIAACSDVAIDPTPSSSGSETSSATTTSSGVTTGGPTDCDPPFADCDGDGSCETSLHTETDCGACGEACLPNGGTASCADGTCVLSCGDGFADCNESGRDGCEAALDSDPDHCGSCDKHCGDHDCFAGACIRMLATAQAALVGADALVVSGGYLYWSTPGVNLVGQIARVPVDGGPTSVVVSDLQFPDYLHGNDAWLVWSDVVTGGIYRMALPVGAAETVLPPERGTLQVLDVDATDVYFTSGTDVRRMPVAGGDEAVLASGLVDVSSGTLDGGNLFVTDLGPEVLADDGGNSIPTHPHGTVGVISTATGAITTIATELDGPVAVAISGDSVFWAEAGSRVTYDIDGVATNLGTLGRVVQANRDGSSRVVIVDGLVQPDALVVNHDLYLYIASAGTVGGVDPSAFAYEPDGSLLAFPLLMEGPLETRIAAIDARVLATDGSPYFASWYYGFIAGF